MLAVDEQASHGSDEALCAPGGGGQLHQPMCQHETAAAPVHLFFGDRPRQAIDDCGRIVVDLLDRAVEVFCPQRESGVAGQHRIAGRDVDLGVVDSECSLRLAEPPVSQRSSTTATLACT